MSISSTARAVCLTFVFFSSAAQGSFFPDDDYGSVHSVAVVSAVGDDIDMNTFGFTLFGDEVYQLHTDWHLDEVIKGEVTKALSGRFAVKDVTVAPETLANMISTEREGGEAHRDAFAQLLGSLSKSSGIDAYVFVLPASDRQDGPIATGRVFGLFGARGQNSQVLFGAYYTVAVYSATTGKEIGGGDDFFSSIMHVEQCSGEMWADKENALTPVQKSRIRQEILSLATRPIPFTLADAHLISFDSAIPLTTQLGLPAEPSCHEPE